MRISHLLLAIAVVFVWGTNFVVIKWGLAEFPPFLLAALRFALSVFPWIFFIPRPAVGWAPLAKFGVLLGAGQFGLLFLAMRSDISPGLASLLMQSQVFFTIGAALVLKGERLRRLQIPATVLALAGIGLIAWHALGPDGGNSVTATGLVLCLLAALCWAAANLVVRAVGRVDALAFMVWSSPFSLPPLIAMSLIFEGGPAVVQSLANASWGGWAVVLWQAVGNTLFGFGAWNWLLARYPAATVAPTRPHDASARPPVRCFWLGAYRAGRFRWAWRHPGGRGVAVRVRSGGARHVGGRVERLLPLHHPANRGLHRSGHLPSR